MKNSFLLLTLLLLFSEFNYGQTTVTLSASKDNTLYESVTGNLSNGAGQYMFVGKNNSGDIRRAVIAFDIATSVPVGATITAASLSLNMSKTSSGAQTINLHRINSDWGEGASNAPGQQGGGTAPMANDATWIHTFFSSSFWTSTGGDYNATASASRSVNTNGSYTWNSSQLTTDVQNMLNNPSGNFGWILLGNESTSQTTKRFDTKEHPTASARPELTITYTLPAQAGKLVINEIDYNQPGTDDAEFIEIKNVDTVAINLDMYSVEFVNGSGGGATIYKTVDLPNLILNPNTYYVICANSDSTNNCDTVVPPATNMIQNGSPDALAIKFNGITIVDAVSYAGNTAAPYTEYSGVGLVDNPANAYMSISRFPDGKDTDTNNVDLIYLCITPGLPNGPAILSFSPSDSGSICPGDSVILTVSGGAEYQWYFNGTPIAGAKGSSIYAKQPGWYNVMASNGECRDSAETGVKVNLKQSPVVDLGPDTIACDFYILNAGNPGATYLWSNGSTSPFLTVFSSGVFAVMVTLNDCSSFDTVSVTIMQTPIVNLGADISSCDPVILNAGNPGASYLWSTYDTTQTIKADTSGTYWVVADNNGCRNSDTVQVEILPSPIVNLGNDTTVCGQIILNAGNPGATYAWNTGSMQQSITVSNSGTYSVTVTQNRCTASDTIQVTVNPLPTVDLGPDFQACNFAILNAGNPGAAYQWSTGEATQTIQVNQSGAYYVTVTVNGCSQSDSIQVIINPTLNVQLGPDFTACDDSILNAGIPNASYLWNTGDTTLFLTVIQSGMYAVTVTQNGCSGSDSILVLINNTPMVNLGMDTTVCDSLMLDAGNPGMTYNWSTGQQTRTIQVYKDNLYWVEVLNDQCRSRDSIVVSVNQSPRVELGRDTSGCGNITLDAGVSNATYKWSSGDTSKTIVVSVSGNYSVTVTQNGCDGSDSINVSVHDNPVIDLGPDFKACDSAQLTVTTIGQYMWSTGQTSQSILINQTGNYAVTVTDSNNCTGNDAVNVSIHPSPVVNLGADTAACDFIILNAGPGFVNYQWVPNLSTGPFLTVTNSGTYSVTVIDSNQCSGADDVNIIIDSVPKAMFTFDTSACPTIGFTNLSTGAIDTLLWSFGDGRTDTTVNPTHDYDSNGVFQIGLIVGNHCGFDTIYQAVSVSCILGIDFPNFSQNINIYPNPTKEIINVQINKKAADKIFFIEIFDAMGRSVITTIIDDFNQATRISLRNLEPGNYFMSISGKHGLTIKQILLIK
jgi:Secretion system C-terminal sorting domain/Lamin Tail Domain/PKD domain